METVAKRKPGPRGGRWLLLAGLLALLGAALLGSFLLNREPDTQAPRAVSTVRTLFSYNAADVQSIAVRQQGDVPWTVVLDAEEGLFVLEGEDGFTLSPATTQELQDAARTLTCEQVLSENPAEYADHLAEYGLDAPRFVAEITFADGRVITLRIGDRAAHTDAWYYMTIDGDDCLYALSTGMVDALFVSRESLRDVTQPTLHKARIDRITLRSGDGSIRAQWALTGDIADSDALDRWQITAPFTYPADADAMSSLLANAANLRLGAYVAPATAGNLTLYGFDAPSQIIEIHMAAGTIGSTDMDGAFTTEDWPESTVTFVIGGERNDMVDYVRFGDSIYVSSHFTMGLFIDLDPRSSMTRYPVLTALGNLASLTIARDGIETAYILTRTEQVAENNDLVTDHEGNPVYDVTVTRDGEPFDYAAFSAAYEKLITVTATGVLPEDAITAETPHTVYTFTDVDGTVHTVALHTYGVLHDAIAVDGHQAFYIAKGGFALGLD